MSVQDKLEYGHKSVTLQAKTRHAVDTCTVLNFNLSLFVLDTCV